jgi:hypothetical protein
VLAFHSVLKPEILAGFAGVFMAGANFEDSAIFRIWGEEGVEFEPDRDFARSLRYSNRPNRDLVTILRHRAPMVEKTPGNPGRGQWSKNSRLHD